MSLSFLREFGNFFHTYVKCGKKDCVNFKFAAGNNLYPLVWELISNFQQILPKCGRHKLFPIFSRDLNMQKIVYG